MYLLVSDDRLSGLQPGHIHYEQIQCEPQNFRVVKALIARSGYTLVKESAEELPNIKSIYWRNLHRLVE